MARAPSFLGRRDVYEELAPVGDVEGRREALLREVHDQVEHQGCAQHERQQACPIDPLGGPMVGPACALPASRVFCRLYTRLRKQ